MAVTTSEQEYKRLRQYLTKAISGPKTDAVLTALADGGSSYLINNVSAVNDQMYIVSASGNYLDSLLAKYQITRPSDIGLGDDIFSQIGIQVKNRKQVRDLINNLIDAMFSDSFVKASNSSTAYEPYNLADGDTLIVNFDQKITANLQFKASDFTNISQATAQEVADSISKQLNSSGLTYFAIAQDDGNGPYVILYSSTIGPASSVTVQGGSAQNVLLFPSPVAAGGNMSTQWTLSVKNGGTIRYTWSNGADPQLGKVSVGNYVNIYGGGFASSANTGSFTITAISDGAVNASYFEIYNPTGTSGIVTQGADNAVLFFNPVRKTLLSQSSYAAVYQTEPQMLQIFLPASTQVVRRSRKGSAHLHYPPYVSYTLKAQPAIGDVFYITSTTAITAGNDFQIGSTILTTVANMVTALSTIQGITAIQNTTTLNVNQNDATLTLVGTYSGSQNITATGPQGDVTSLAPNQPGPYVYNLSQPFVISDVATTLTQNLNATSSKVVQVKNSSDFPDEQGYLILGYGTEQQEGPVPYIARPSNDTLLISPAYTIQNVHVPNEDVALVAQKSPVVLDLAGGDYEFFITGVVSGREYAQSLIQSVAAIGINIVFTILYPGDRGLGKWGTQYSEITEIWS